MQPITASDDIIVKLLLAVNYLSTSSARILNARNLMKSSEIMDLLKLLYLELEPSEV